MRASTERHRTRFLLRASAVTTRCSMVALVALGPLACSSRGKEPEVAGRPERPESTAAHVPDRPESVLQPPKSVAWALRSDVARVVPASGAEERAIRDLGEFAWSFYGQARTGDQNFVYSPYSIAVACAMLSAGAVGQTLAEIRAALKFSQTGERLHDAHNALGRLLESRNCEATERSSGQTLRVANDFWMRRDLTPAQAFLETLARSYDSGMHLAAFDSDPEGARRAINDKVRNDTGGLIRELLVEGRVDRNTVFVLTNALYFRGRWEHVFSKSETRSLPFTTLDGARVDVPTMHGPMMRGRYASGDGYIAVSLPYAQKQLEMVFLVPDAGTFAKFVETLDARTVETMISGLKGAYLDIWLPSFEITAEVSLKQELIEAGMTRAFHPGMAEFPLIGNGIFVNDALHQARLVLDEEGTEAAAATAFLGVVSGARVLAQPIPVRIDRPFVFFLRDVSEAVLFVGHVVDPR